MECCGPRSNRPHSGTKPGCPAHRRRMTHREPACDAHWRMCREPARRSGARSAPVLAPRPESSPESRFPTACRRYRHPRTRSDRYGCSPAWVAGRSQFPISAALSPNFLLFASCWTRAPALSNIRARSAMTRSARSSPLDDESMAIDVVPHQAVGLADHPIDQPGHPTARIEAVIVEHDDAAGYQPRPHPVEGLGRRFIHVDIDMTEAEPAVGDPVSRGIGKDNLQDFHVGQPHASHEVENDGRAGVRALAADIGRILPARLCDSGKRVAEKHRATEIPIDTASGKKAARSAAPDAHFEDVALFQRADLATQLPKLVAAVLIDKGMRADRGKHLPEARIPVPGR